MIRTLGVPPLSGGRPRARALRDTLPDDLRDVEVVVDFRDLLVPTESFADELVLGVLRDGGAKQMSAINVDPQTAGWLHDSADEWQVAERLVVDRHG